MKIVVLDGATMNPGDLDWGKLAALGDLTHYPRTAPDQILERCRDAAAVITNKVVLDAATLAALPQLRYIGASSTGYNIIDVAAAARNGITVTNVPAYSTAAVAQLTFAHLLNLANRTALHADSVRQGEWSQKPDFCYWLTPQIELAGRTIGLYGFGAIGKAVARIADAFGMRVLAYRRRGAIDYPGVTLVSPDELFRRSDILSLHCPLTAETSQLINAATLANMKPGAWLINTARGGLIDETATAAALRSGQLGGFAADTLSTEPPAADNPLLAAPNSFITPHIAWAALAARKRLYDTVVANLAAFQRGQAQNVVS